MYNNADSVWPDDPRVCRRNHCTRVCFELKWVCELLSRSEITLLYLWHSAHLSLKSSCLKSYINTQQGSLGNSLTLFLFDFLFKTGSVCNTTQQKIYHPWAALRGNLCERGRAQNYFISAPRSPCDRRRLQLGPWRPRWSTLTHTSTSPFHGPRGAAGLGSPPACLGTPSKPESRRQDRHFQMNWTQVRTDV